MSRQLRPSPVCLNCGAAVTTRFCAHCGQENTTYRVSLGRLLGDLFEELFQLESRLWRTLWTLFRRPGLLTREYNAGRRVSYTTPLRLYLTASVSFFFIAAVVPPRVDDPTQLKFELSKNDVGVDLDHLPPPKTWIARRVRERLGMMQRADPKEISRRGRELLVTNTPKVMALLVPAFGLILMLFFRRRYYVEHLVFALHLHAFAFSLGALAMLTRVNALINIWMLVAALWGLVAMHAVYGQSWWRTSWKWLCIVLLYNMLLGFGVLAALIGGFFLG